VERLLIVGCGDIARRALPDLRSRYRVTALARSREPALDHPAGFAGTPPLQGDIELIEADLDRPESLAPLAGRAECIVHFAPPAGNGSVDVRTRNLIAALGPRGRGAMLPQRFLYLSTSGVYGDCGGEWVDEQRPPGPTTDRARRRLDAERAIGDWGERNNVEVVILRVPGIYASDRLPLDRLIRGTPALVEEEDVYTNHIHADDLAAIVVAALQAGRGIYNASDDGPMKMGDFLDLVADRAGLARPPRVSRDEAGRRVPKELLSFMSESRRLVNKRMKQELGVRLRYPTVADGVPMSVQTV
jgi:nucleoside-diphosphate-sugar epimerase